MSYKDYTNPAVAMNDWFENIAPKYFNFNVAELHRTGIFGYTNEVMSTVENDTAHAVSIARREFYPTTAQYTKSLYKMAALQQISYPFAHAAQATAILLLQESDIINCGEYNGSRYKFVLDNTMTIDAGGIPFRMDYPLVIIAKRRNVGGGILSNPEEAATRSKAKYAYTVRYDISHSNDISELNNYYITYRTVTYNNTPYLLVKVSLHQCTEIIMTEMINKSPVINNIELDFPFDGKLCNFEVFYSDSEGSAVKQLKKLPLNSNPINGDFCMYSMVDPQTLRITFPENPYFTPKFNSSLTVKLYTTMGSEGNFASYAGSLICTPNSEDYPYNNTCIISGQLQGSSLGGVDFPSQEDFRNDVITAYATNKTITTENDLQVYFDSVMTDTRNKVIFQKKRDDVFERLYAAYMILKDLNGNIVPANTLNLDIEESQFDMVIESFGKSVVKPGHVLRYQKEGHYYTSYYDLYKTNANLNTDINDNVDDFSYTNIFLMQIMKSPNMVGFYLNTVNETIDITPVRDRAAEDTKDDLSYLQFNVSSVNVVRNAIRGENFYKLTVSMQPSIVNSGFEEMAFIPTEDLSSIDSFPSEIRAEYGGIVEGFQWCDSEGSNTGGSVYMIIRYKPDIPGVTRQTLTKYVEEDWMPNDKDNPDDLRIWIRVNSPVYYTETANGQRIFDTPAWYSTELHAGDVFTAGSIIATRKPKDNGVLRVVAEFKTELGLYVPLALDSYDKDTDSYTFAAYLATEDYINEDGRLVINGGFCNMLGDYRSAVAIDPTDCDIYISTFIQYDDINYEHKFKNYAYLVDHTLTNIFESTGNKLNFLYPMKFIRSTVSFYDIITPDPTGDIEIILSGTGHHLMHVYRDGTNLEYGTAYIMREDYSEDDIYYLYRGALPADISGDACCDNPDCDTYAERVNLLPGIYTDADGKHIFIEPSDDDKYNYNISSNIGYAKNTLACRITGIPLIRSNWLRNSGNVFDLVQVIRRNYDYLLQIYDLLENNYSIDLKFFNTYGKSRFFRIGIRNDEMVTLNKVNIVPRFGIKLNILSPYSEFEGRFISFVKEYIESFNDVTNKGKAILIMDLITAIKNNFPEIERLEYYGIDNYNVDAAQIIETMTDEEIRKLDWMQYVPEFINIYCDYHDNILEPKIDIQILE